MASRDELWELWESLALELIELSNDPKVAKALRRQLSQVDADATKKELQTLGMALLAQVKAPKRSKIVAALLAKGAKIVLGTTLGTVVALAATDGYNAVFHAHETAKAAEAACPVQLNPDGTWSFAGGDDDDETTEPNEGVTHPVSAGAHITSGGGAAADIVTEDETPTVVTGTPTIIETVAGTGPINAEATVHPPTVVQGSTEGPQGSATGPTRPGSATEPPLAPFGQQGPTGAIDPSSTGDDFPPTDDRYPYRLEPQPSDAAPVDQEIPLEPATVPVEAQPLGVTGTINVTLEDAYSNPNEAPPARRELSDSDEATFDEREDPPSPESEGGSEGEA